MMHRNTWRNLRLVGMIVALALPGLGAGCRGQETGESTPVSQPAPSEGQAEVTISFACHEVEVGRYQDLAEQFHEENPHIKVRVLSITEILGLEENYQWPEDAWQQLVSAADTLVLGASPRVTRQGLVRDLTPFIEADQGFHPEDFYPAALESLQWDGGTWGIPSAINFGMIFYDGEAFDEAGVAYPEPGWTWDDFLAKAQALTKREGDEVIRWGFVQPWFDPLPFITGRTGPLVDDSITPPIPLLDEPEVAQAVCWYTDLYLEYRVTPFLEPPDVEPGEPVRPEGFSLIEEGVAAMWSDVSFTFQWRSQQSREIGIVPYPVDKPTDATTPIFVESYAMSAGTAHPQEAWRWLDFLTRRADLDPYGFSLPARRSTAAEMGFWDDLDKDVTAACYFALEHAYSRRLAYAGAGGALHEALTAILKGEKDVEEALVEAQVVAQQRLSEEAGEREQITPQPVVVATPEPVGEEGVEITFAPFLYNVAPYRELAETFHEDHPDVTVKVRRPTFSGRYGLEEMAAAGDCFGWFGLAADESSQQHMLNLQPFLDADPAFSRADFYPQALEPFRWQGDLWGLPGEALVKVLAYNPDLFDAAGVAYPQAGWDLDDFLAQARALTQGEGEDKQYGFVSLHGGSDDLDTFIALQGVSLMDEERDPPWPRLDAPAVVEAVRWYVELSTVHGVGPLFPGEDPSRPETSSWERRQALLSEDKAAMWTISSFNEGTFPGSPDRMGVAPLPLNDGGAIPSSFLGYYISAATLYPRQCWEWLKFLSDHGQRVARGLPARRSAAESPEYAERVGEEMAAAMRFSLQHGASGSPVDTKPWLRPITYSWFWQAFGQAMQGQDVAQALEEAQHKAETYVLCLEREGGFTDEDVQGTCARDVDPDYREFGE